MAAARTGTASQVDASGGNGSTSVTVPADATAAVAFWAHFDDNGGSTLSSLTLGSNSFSVKSQLAEGATTDETGTGVAFLGSLPGTGSQTLAWTWSAGGARSEGGGILIVWVKDHNTADPVRDADCDARTWDVATTTLTTDTTDLVLGLAQTYGDDPAISAATVFVHNWAVNSERYDAGEITAGSGTTTVTHSAANYSTVAAISLKDAAGGGSSVTGSFAQTFTLGIATAAKATRKAALTQAFTLGVASAAKANRKAASQSTYTLGIAPVGVRTTFGSATVPIVLGINSQWAGSAILGAASLEMALNVASAALRDAHAISQATFTLGIDTAAIRTKYGASASEYTWGADVAAKLGLFGSSYTPLAFNAAVAAKQGHKGAVHLPVIVGIFSREHTAGLFLEVLVEGAQVLVPLNLTVLPEITTYGLLPALDLYPDTGPPYPRDTGLELVSSSEASLALTVLTES